MIFEIQNLTKRRISEDFIKKIIHTTAQFEGRDKNGNISMGLALVGRARMQALNWRYNKKDRATDVLSFSGGEGFIAPKNYGEYLGEIIVCPQVIQKQASHIKVSFEREFSHILIHGILHLFGYSHKGSLEAVYNLHAKEEKIISRIFSG